MNHFVISIDYDGELKHIEKLGEDEFIASRKKFRELLEIEKEYKKAKKYVNPYEYAKLKCRYMLENAIKMTGGTPIDWACYNITQFLHDYLKEHNVKDSDSITEKRMQTVAFAHCLEDKLLDYIDKLEEFNS